MGLLPMIGTMAVKLLSEHNLRKAERSPGMSMLRKLLYTLMIIGGVGSTIGAGTFASNTAATTNAGSAFASGTLVLNREISATACLSVGAGTATDANSNATCSAMFSPNRIKLGDAPTTVDLTIENKGTTSGTLAYYAMDADTGTGGSQACLSSTNGIFWADGTGNLCTSTNIIIQEYTTAAFTTAKASCVYPAQASTACKTWTTGVIGSTQYGPTTVPTWLPGSLPTTATTQGAMLAGEKRYYRVSMNLPSTVSDQMQGRLANLGLTWTLVGT